MIKREVAHRHKSDAAHGLRPAEEDQVGDGAVVARATDRMIDY